MKNELINEVKEGLKIKKILKKQVQKILKRMFTTNKKSEIKFSIILKLRVVKQY